MSTHKKRTVLTSHLRLVVSWLHVDSAMDVLSVAKSVKAYRQKGTDPTLKLVNALPSSAEKQMPL